MQAASRSPHAPPDRAAISRKPLADFPANAPSHSSLSRTPTSRKRLWSADILPESDPGKTCQLWHAVAARKKRRMPDRKPGGARAREANKRVAGAGLSDTTKESRASLLRLEIDTLQSGSSGALTENASVPENPTEGPDEISSTRSRNVRPHNSQFKNLVLDPCYIDIDERRTIVPNACAHFKTTKPTGLYKQLPELGEANVWLNIDQTQRDRIVKHYAFMQHKRLCEDEFATFAKETFFKGEAREIEPPKDRRWRSERMLQLFCPPSNDALWSAPPIMLSESVHDDYKWDLRPDCAYWLSLRGFNAEYSFCVSDSCFVHQEWITCPYLTIEFKRDDWKPDVAKMQVAAASAIAVYNRHNLRIRAFESGIDDELGPSSRAIDMSTVRHYGITFTGPTYTTWLIRPTPPPSDSPPIQWSGCKMSRLGHGNCTDAAGVGRLADWINEIHRWGLSTHAESCQWDIKLLLNAGGVETSLVE